MQPLGRTHHAALLKEGVQHYQQVQVYLHIGKLQDRSLRLPETAARTWCNDRLAVSEQTTSGRGRREIVDRVNLPRCTTEEMEAAAKSTFISPITGARVTHTKISTYRKHGCRCAPCVQAYRDYRSAYRVQAMARKGKVTRQRARRDGNDYLAPSEWSTIWIPARKAVGVDVTPYQLRHSHASLLLAHGVPLPDVQARPGHNDLTSTTHYVWALAEESETAATTMNVLLGYETKQPGPQEAMLARMEAMMHRMQAMIDPPLARQIAAESSTSRPDLHLVTDTLTALQFPTGN
jgi:hypothetical protein